MITAAYYRQLDISGHRGQHFIFIILDLRSLIHKENNRSSYRCSLMLSDWGVYVLFQLKTFRSRKSFNSYGEGF